MERERSDALIELGIASSDTLGYPVGTKPEVIAYFPLGIGDE